MDLTLKRVKEMLDAGTLPEFMGELVVSDIFGDPREFVAYAMTDFQFQNELAKLQVPSLGKYTLQGDLGNLAKSAWFQFTTALSQMYNLIKAGPTGLKLYDEVYTGVAKDFATVKGSLNELYKDVTDDDLAFEEASYEETEPKAPAKFMAAKRLLSIHKD